MKSILIQNGIIWNGDTFLQGDLYAKDGVICELGASQNRQADFVYDAAGCIVSPGLIDIHAHLRHISSEEFGVDGESSCFPFGVTAAVDASCLECAERSLYESFLLKGCVFACTAIQDNRADFTGTCRVLEQFAGKVVGLKVYMDTEQHEHLTIEPFQEICEFAHARGLRVMVHTSNSPVSMRELFDCLAKGDILTHMYHGGTHTILDDREALEHAYQKGIVMDLGMAGGVHTDFAVARAAIADGFVPDTISTDITKYSAFIRGGRYGMTAVLSMLRELGMAEQDILRGVTSNAAKSVGMETAWGRLAVGRAADICVLRYGKDEIDMADKAGHRLVCKQGYTNLLTVLDGQVVYRR